MKTKIFFFLFLIGCATNLKAQEDVDIFKNRLLGTWRWEKGYLCEIGAVELPPDSLKKAPVYSLIFYPDRTIERFRNDTLIRRSRYTINKVRTYPTKVAFKLKSEMFKGEAMVTYYFNDELIISNCVWDDYNL